MRYSGLKPEEARKQFHFSPMNGHASSLFVTPYVLGTGTGGKTGSPIFTRVVVIKEHIGKSQAQEMVQ